MQLVERAAVRALDGVRDTGCMSGACATCSMEGKAGPRMAKSSNKVDEQAKHLEPSANAVTIILSAESGTKDFSLSAGAHNLERNNDDHQQHGPPLRDNER